MHKAAPLFFVLAGQAAHATTWRNIEHVKTFPGMRTELQHRADEFGTHSLNHFCVVVGDDTVKPDGDFLAYVYWFEEQQILTFSESGKEPMSDDYEYAAGSINLKRDVTSDKTNNLGVKLVKRSYVNSIINACYRYGTRFMVSRRGRY